MLRMNRFFNGGGVAGHTKFGGLGDRGNTLPWFGSLAVLPGGFGQIFSAVPDGYGLDNGLYPPLTEGAMASFDPDAMKFTGGSASAVKAVALTGDGPMVLTGNDANMGAIATLEGEGQMALAGNDANLLGVAELEGEGQMSLTGDGNLGAVAPMEGHGTMSLTGTGSIRGTVSMAGEFRNSDDVVTVDYGGEIYIADWGEDSQTYPAGTATYPLRTIAAADVLAERYGLKTYYIKGSFTLEKSYANTTFIGWGPLQFNKIDLNDQELDSVRFKSCVVEGKLNTTAIGGGGWQSSIARVEFENCYLQSIEDLQGTAHHCQIDGPTLLKAGGWFSSADTIIEGDFTVFDFRSTTGTVLSMDVASGWCQVDNAVAGCLIELNVKGGEVSLYATCTGGEYYLEGVGTLFNNSAMTKKENHFIWDEDASYVNTPDTTGAKLNAAGAAGDPWATPQGQSVLNNTGLVPATL